MPNSDIRQSILDLLQNFSFDHLKQLFWTELNYERVNQPLARRGWSDAAANALAENPLLFAAGGAHQDFHVLYARLDSDKLLLGSERPVIATLLNEHPYALFVFSNATQDHWHFVNVKYDSDVTRRKIFRRIVIGPHERLRTAAERIAMLDLAAMSKPMFGLDALAIQTAHDDAFDVEAVTEQFFGHYQVVFEQLQNDLRKQTRDAEWAHAYALQFLNRLMFLYFIQRKRWLGDDPDFICNFWETYKKSRAPKDSFYRDWLAVLFFEAFNKQFQAGRSDRQHLPKPYRDALALAPYLNGGLFAENDLDKKHAVKISDDIFVALFDRFDNQTPGFFERYNFTIREDSPFDQEVAVDPEMIGKVYESLVNVTSEGVEETDQRGSAGIFYTPRVEIDLMCRLALVDCLANHLGEKFKPLLYRAVFAYDDADKQAADDALAREQLWQPLNELIRQLTVCDPACGSGSFIVGMLMVLDDVQARANARLGIAETMYQRRKRIIGQSLYGVDVMDWAVHTAELRLWLQLIIETDLDAAEMQMQPLLPNLSFKLRVGDSLVQQVGGIVFNVERERLTIPAPLKRKLTALKEEKLKFYNDIRSSKFKSEQALKKEELNLFREILDARADELDKRIRALKREIAQSPEQTSLPGIEKLEHASRALRENRARLETMEEELAEVQAARAALGTAQDVPFVWDIAFVEIFEGDEKGFDIVVGNPPYVRQEMIAPPHLREQNFKPDAWREKKRAYKDQLQRAVAEAYPRFFNYRHGAEKFRRLDGKSDLYVYFYLLGLKRLNPRGSFCFITSNSWLDVGYGKDLQEFLLTQSHVKMILDNQAKRSFKQADVNTIIALLAPPNAESAVRQVEIGSKPIQPDSSPDRIARFVMFRVPFENVLSPTIFQEIEQARERTSTPAYRVMPIAQSVLSAEGMAVPDDEEETPARGIATAKYGGGKWGGRYLRAPDIFYVILEKGKGKLVRLGEIAEIKRGPTTGANEFFYLDEDAIKRWGIESRFLESVIKSPRECKSIVVTPKDGTLSILMCHKDKKELRGTNVLEYITWGEKEKINSRPTLRGRSRWWDLGEWKYPDMIWPDAYNNRYGCFEISGNCYGDKRFFFINFHRRSVATRAYLNSTLIPLFIELEGIKNLGEGVIYTNVYWLKGLPVLAEANEDLTSAYNKIKNRKLENIYEEIQCSDRRALDDVIFDGLGLTRGERDAVYEAVVELVQRRLEKAGSVGK
jgi:hypothetical protein